MVASGAQAFGSGLGHARAHIALSVGWQLLYAPAVAEQAPALIKVQLAFIAQAFGYAQANVTGIKVACASVLGVGVLHGSFAGGFYGCFQCSQFLLCCDCFNQIAYFCCRWVNFAFVVLG